LQIAAERRRTLGITHAN